MTTDQKMATPLPVAGSKGTALLLQPYVLVPLANTLAVAAYARAGLAEHPARAALSLAASTAAGMGLYYAVFCVLRGRGATTKVVAVLLALGLAGLHLVSLGYYQVFRSLIPPSVVDYVRQHPWNALAILRDNFSVLHGGAALVLAGGLGWHFLRACDKQRGPAKLPLVSAIVAWAILAVVGRYPYLSLDQYALVTVARSLRSEGRTSPRFWPNRMPLSPLERGRPVNVVFFLLEAIARDAAQLYNPSLPTMPFWSQFAAEHPDEVFVAQNHFSNSSATDVAIPMIFTGAAAEDPLQAHSEAPLLWDYAKSASYNTSAFFPFALTWGDFHVRFQQRPGVMNLDHVVHAGNAGKPLVYDSSINDSDVLEAALSYQRERGWGEPFLQVVALKMPHFLGQGTQINGFKFLDGRLPRDRLIHYYNSIYHNDDLMGQFLKAMPEDVRERTIVLAVSDHGEDLYGRGVRLENYHQEIAQVPCWLYISRQVQEHIGAEAIQQLRHNLQSCATSNLDLVPTLLDLMGLAEQEPVHKALLSLKGRSWLRPYEPQEFIVMLNTNCLRRWDREGFALTMDNGRIRYIYNLGEEGLFDLAIDPREERNLAGDPAYAQWLQKARDRVNSEPLLRRILLKYSKP